MSDDITLCRLEEITEGGSKGLWPDWRDRALVFAVRQGDQVHVYRNICPHYGQSRLGWKKDSFLNGDGTRIICAAHGALFGISDGVCTLGPCLGEQLDRVPFWIKDGAVMARQKDLPAPDQDIRSRA